MFDYFERVKINDLKNKFIFRFRDDIVNFEQFDNLKKLNDVLQKIENRFDIETIFKTIYKNKFVTRFIITIVISNRFRVFVINLRIFVFNVVRVAISIKRKTIKIIANQLTNKKC